MIKKITDLPKNARVTKMHASMSIRTLHARTLAWSPDIEIQISNDLVFPMSKQTILIENSNLEFF